MTLDELLFGEERLGLGFGDEEVDGGHLTGQAIGVRAPGEVRGDPLADRARLAHVDDLPVTVAEQVHARLIGELLPLLVQ